jgi:hypothetical protein
MRNDENAWHMLVLESLFPNYLEENFKASKTQDKGLKNENGMACAWTKGRVGSDLAKMTARI